MGPLWTNTQYTAAVPAGGTGLVSVRPAISEVANFCTDEMSAGRSLAPMKGEGVVYSPQWYDVSGKPLDCLTASPLTNPDEPPSSPEGVPNEEVPLVTPAPVNMAGNGPDNDTKSKKASSSESESESGSSGSGSGSGDSSPDSASSHSGSGEDDTNSNTQSKATTNIRSGRRGNLINPTETRMRKLFQR